MPKKIELSIVIVNFNTAEITVNCLQSIKKYPPSVEYEIIVIDNASSDNSLKFLSKQKITLIKNSKNYGFAYANNQGITKAKGEYILLLNSDTLVTKNSIGCLLDFAKSKKNLGAVVPKLLNSDKSTQASVFRFPTINRAIKQYWFGINQFLEKFAPQNTNPVKVEAAVMAAFLITPLALKKVGKLNEKYFMYYEDIDYCRKLKKENLDIYYIPDSKVIHLHGASGKNLAHSKDQWKRLIPSSKIYHGVINHYLYNTILWSGQKIQNLKQLLS